MSDNEIYVECYSGIGDTVYQRAALKALAARHDTVYIRTPWPEIYADIPNMKFICPKHDYRTQTKNIQRLADFPWATLPSDDIKKITIEYDGLQMAHNNICQIYEKQIPLNGYPFEFDVPVFPEIDLSSLIDNKGKPIAVVRPVTIRKEWIASARSPNSDHVYQLSYELFNAGYHVVAIADLEPNVEWLVGHDPVASQRFYGGELNMKQLITLIRSASIVVGGVGWIVPMAIACHTPLYILFGGQGSYNQMSRLTDIRMDLTKIGYAVPENFCKCTMPTHNCPKKIINLGEKFWDFMRELQILKRIEDAKNVALPRRTYKKRTDVVS